MDELLFVIVAALSVSYIFDGKASYISPSSAFVSISLSLSFVFFFANSAITTTSLSGIVNVNALPFTVVSTSFVSSFKTTSSDSSYPSIVS